MGTFPELLRGIRLVMEVKVLGDVEIMSKNGSVVLVTSSSHARIFERRFDSIPTSALKKKKY